MNSLDHTPEPEKGSGDQPPSGPNLILIYGLLGLALIIAIVLAVFIVLPFYQRR